MGMSLSYGFISRTLFIYLFTYLLLNSYSNVERRNYENSENSENTPAFYLLSLLHFTPIHIRVNRFIKNRGSNNPVLLCKVK